MKKVLGNVNNADDPWRDDLFNRKVEAEFLYDFLTERAAERGEIGEERSYVLNLDAPWGAGKTFFLDRLARQISDAHLLVRINAWQDDYADDPLVAVMAEIERSLTASAAKTPKARAAWKKVKNAAGPILMAAAKGAALRWGEKAIGDGLEEAARILGAEGAGDDAQIATGGASDALKERSASRARAMVDEFLITQEAIAAFKSDLRHLASLLDDESKSLPVFVFVDELDRCRPLYAIAMLERIKHLFDVKGFVFVVATDSSQLRHAITAVYGAGFDGERYLRRFFDGKYVLARPDIQGLVSKVTRDELDPEKISFPPGCSADSFISGVFASFPLEPRDVEQCLDLVRTCVTAWKHPVPLVAPVLLPLVVGFHFGVMPDISSDFVAELERRLVSVDKSGNVAPLKVSFKSLSGRRAEDTEVGIPQLFALFRAVKGTPLTNLINLEDDSPQGSWVRDLYWSEFQKIHNGQSKNSNPRYSLIATYPKLVLSAGRMSVFEPVV